MAARDPCKAVRKNSFRIHLSCLQIRICLRTPAIKIQSLNFVTQPRRHLSAALFAVCAFVSGCASVQPTLSSAPVTSALIKVTRVPARTPPLATVYIAGNFNGWNPGDTAYRLAPDGRGGYSIALPPTITGPIEFKFTLGSWNAVETDSAGGQVPNRGIVVKPGIIYSGTVVRWSDPGTKVVRRHSARPTVSILTENFEIPQLGRTRRLWVYLPSDYATTSTKYPVLYMHDGQNVFDNATSFAGEWGVDETLDSLRALGDRGVIVIAVDNGGVKRTDEYTPWKNAKYGGGEGERYVDFLVKTLKPYVDSHFRTLPDRMNTAIAGSSLGALISLYAVLKYPMTFGRVGIFSPAFWIALELITLVHDAGRLPSDVKLYFVIGGQETANAEEAASVIKDQTNVVDALVAGGLKRGANIVSYVRADGKHAEWFWRREFPAAYQWLFSH